MRNIVKTGCRKNDKLSADKSPKHKDYATGIPIQECRKVNAPLPLIDAENGGVSINASGCEKYMSILRYGQYGQVGADGIWRSKENVDRKSGDKKAAIKFHEEFEYGKENFGQKNDRSLTEVLTEVLTKKNYEKVLPIIKYLDKNKEITPQIAEAVLKKSKSTTYRYLSMLVGTGYVEVSGNTNNAVYKVVLK
ncbi:MAG: transcriptional regulator [Muribaculum sp.]|nr:transcriptional regulator [Muribaculum sp.]